MQPLAMYMAAMMGGTSLNVCSAVLLVTAADDYLQVIEFIHDNAVR